MGFWHAQVTTDKKDAQGKAVRDWVTLDTADMAVAERRLARYLAEQGAGRTPEAAAAAASAPDTVQVYFAGLGKRLADGDNANIRIHVLPTIGTFALDEVQHVQVRNILKKVSEEVLDADCWARSLAPCADFRRRRRGPAHRAQPDVRREAPEAARRGSRKSSSRARS